VEPNRAIVLEGVGYGTSRLDEGYAAKFFSPNLRLMLSHISLGVSNLERSLVFYDAILATLGYVRVWRDADAAGYGRPGGDDEFAIKQHEGALQISSYSSSLSRCRPCFLWSVVVASRFANKELLHIPVLRPRGASPRPSSGIRMTLEVSGTEGDVLSLIVYKCIIN